MRTGGLADWTAEVCAALGVDAGGIDTEEVVRFAKDVRRAAGGPAAFVAVHLLGVAVGRGADPREAAARLADLTGQRSVTECDWRD